MDTCKRDLISHLEFQENLGFYLINKLQSLARSFCENKLERKYRTLSLSMKVIH